MIIDTSAIVAILFKEEGYLDLIEKLSSADSLAVGAPSLTETGIVLAARLGNGGAYGILAGFIRTFGIITIPFGEGHWREAIAAYQTFGRGRHAARLNFGDCLTYAVAMLADQPLLCVGEDFRLTDLKLA